MTHWSVFHDGAVKYLGKAEDFDAAEDLAIQANMSFSWIMDSQALENLKESILTAERTT